MELLEPLLTTEDVAKFLSVDVVTVRRLVSRGELAAYRIGGEYRFSQTDLREFLAQQRLPMRQGADRTDELVPVGQRMLGALPPFLRPGTPDRQFDKFTKRAKQVMQYAHEEALGFNHPYVGTEHLLLGLIRDEEGIAGKVLDGLEVKLEQARNSVELVVGRGQDDTPPEHTDLTARAKKVIEYALDEGLKLSHHYIGTEHLLLGLLRNGEGVATGVLEMMGVTLEQVRAAVLQALAPGPKRA